MNAKVSTAIVIPSYNEALALPELLREIVVGLSSADAIIVMDDSSKEVSTQIQQKCHEVIKGSECKFIFNNSGHKSGRGAAVRRGMIIALDRFPDIKTILECDADGSHRPEDILMIKNSLNRADLLVGSRYLKSSEIVGWPTSRRLFSWLLNKSIPRLTKVHLRDITNGLRRYTKRAVLEILSENQVNKGFIYLSEQAILISKSGLLISEEPIIFVNRILGTSTVTWREISNSLYGILKLVLANRRK
jgi:dolichol-phosphate mannosyltransferase